SKRALPPPDPVLLALHGDPPGALVGEGASGPVDDRLSAILVRRQELQVHRPPRGLRLRSGHRTAAEHLYDRGPAPNRRHGALVAVLEGLRLLSGDSVGDRLSGVLP